MQLHPWSKKAKATPTGDGGFMDALPSEICDDIFRRVSLRGLAACRRVCRRWRAAVDALGLLQKLPRSLTGVFINYFGHHRPIFFARRGRHTGAQVDSLLDFVPKPNRRWSINIRDLCNGLLLCDIGRRDWFFCNPATRQWAALPHPGPPLNDFAARTDYLAFDPVASASPHYHIIRFPDPELVLKEEVHGPLNLMEWPPSLFKMRVFSSVTWRWEERGFVREGPAVVTLADVLSEEADELYCPEPWAMVESSKPTDFCYVLARRRNAVYWKGALYVHSRGDFVTKLSLPDDKYEVIKTPTDSEVKPPLKFVNYQGEATKSYLGKSEKGVYYATLDECQLWVWVLDEASGPMEWILKYHIDLKPLTQEILELETGSCQEDVLKKRRQETAWILDGNSADDELDSSCSDDDTTLGADSDDTELPCYNSDDDSVDNDGNEWNSDGMDSFSDGKLTCYDSDDDVILDDGSVNNDRNEWNSDDGYTVDVQHINKGSFDDGNLFLLGFHPFKEVVFLGTFFSAAACHLRDSKAQYVGSLLPRVLKVPEALVDEHDEDLVVVCILESFPYTPCLTDLISGNDN